MYIYGLEIRSNEERIRVDNLLAQHAEIFKKACEKIEQELSSVKKNLNVSLFLPYYIVSKKQEETSNGKYTEGDIDICIRLEWDFTTVGAQTFNLSGYAAHFDLVSKETREDLSFKALDEYVEFVVREVKAGNLDFNQ
jgi:hypothetical protein